MNFDPKSLPPMEYYQLMIGAIIPRPIAWISTISSEGITNLAPYSFFTVASVVPPVLAVTHINPRDQRKEKDTLRNLRTTGECVVNIVDQAHAEIMNATCANYPAEISEFDALGVGQVPSHRVRPPSVAGVPARFECMLRDILSIGGGPQGGHLMLLDVIHIHIRDDTLDNGLLLPERVDAVGKLGADDYSTIHERFAYPRPVLK